jgi:gag-polyprotein putative aspartyl protease
MPLTKCGFNSSPNDPTLGAQLLIQYGPTLIVSIGFDPNYNPATPTVLPIPGIVGVDALVDTGASESCIDSLLAAQLNLPVVDKRPISGIHGKEEVNMHLAQIYVPALAYTIYGAFAGVHLVAGGQTHKALLGRTFLRRFRLIYEGDTGSVTISS